jgi:hypothetical protein
MNLKLITVLTLLTSLSVSASSLLHEETHKGYAEWFVSIGSNKISHSRIECLDSDNSGYYRCKLHRILGGSEKEYQADYTFLKENLDKMNSSIWVDTKHKVPELYITKDETEGANQRHAATIEATARNSFEYAKLICKSDDNENLCLIKKTGGTSIEFEVERKRMIEWVKEINVFTVKIKIKNVAPITIVKN